MRIFFEHERKTHMLDSSVLRELERALIDTYNEQTNEDAILIERPLLAQLKANIEPLIALYTRLEHYGFPETAEPDRSHQELANIWQNQLDMIEHVLRNSIYRGFNSSKTEIMQMCHGFAHAKQFIERHALKLVRDDIASLQDGDPPVSLEQLFAAGIQTLKGGRSAELNPDDFLTVTVIPTARRPMTAPILNPTFLDPSTHNKPAAKPAAKKIDKDALATAMKKLEGLVGLDEAKEYIGDIPIQLHDQEQRLRHGLAPVPVSWHLALSGPPGTGKSTLAEILAEVHKACGRLSRGHLVQAKAGDLVGEYVGHTAGKINGVIRSAIGGVLLLDEAHGLLSEGNKYSDEVFAPLMDAMEKHRDNFIVIFATYPDKIDKLLEADRGLARRLGTILKLPHYTPAQLLEISNGICDGFALTLDADASAHLLQVFGRYTDSHGAVSHGQENFGNGGFARKVIEQANLARARRVYVSADSSREALTTLSRADIEAGYARAKKAHETANDVVDGPSRNPIGFQIPRAQELQR